MLRCTGGDAEIEAQPRPDFRRGGSVYSLPGDAAYANAGHTPSDLTEAMELLAGAVYCRPYRIFVGKNQREPGLLNKHSVKALDDILERYRSKYPLVVDVIDYQYPFGLFSITDSSPYMIEEAHWFGTGVRL